MSNRQIVMGLILVGLGVILLGKTLDLFDFSFDDFVSFLFPALLIAIGIWLLARRRGQTQAAEAGPGTDAGPQAVRSAPQAVRPGPEVVPAEPPPYRPASEKSVTPTDSPPPPSPGESGEAPRVSASPQPGGPGKLRYSKFIGDMFVDCRDVDLQNVEVGNFLGDVEVKLHGGRLQPGLNRMIISGFIGDVRVLVPQGMAVFAQCSNFIGDIEMMGRRSAGFGNSLDAQTPDYAEAESKLYIASNHFIGDVRVYVV